MKKPVFRNPSTGELFLSDSLDKESPYFLGELDDEKEVTLVTKEAVEDVSERTFDEKFGYKHVFMFPENAINKKATYQIEDEIPKKYIEAVIFLDYAVIIKDGTIPPNAKNIRIVYEQ